MRDRLRLLGGLRHAGWLPVSTLATIVVGQALLPAASAAAVGLLVGRVAGALPPWFTLAGFVTVLLLGHLLDSVLEPVWYLIERRIDGAHRAALVRVVADTPYLAELEDPQVRDLVRVASADPDNWTERTPGAGAVAQLREFGRVLGALLSSAVLAAYAWWLIPILAVPAYLIRRYNRRNFLAIGRAWAAGAVHGRRAGYWKDAVMSAAGGKEQRVYGFGDWAVDRVSDGVRAMFSPVWELGRRGRRLGLLSAALMAVPLGVVFIIVSAGVVRGSHPVAVQAAVFSAGLSVYLAIGSMQAAMDIDSSLPVVAALAELRQRLAQSPARRGTVRDGRVKPPLLQLSGVDFTYPGTSRPVIQGLDLEIRPGELLAIVGFNGAGKSTLIKLLAGLYQPGAGRIAADGVDLRELGVAAWRRQLAVVFQDFVRYPLSAVDNVTLGNPTVPRDEDALHTAAAQAGLNDVIAGLPAGWDTPLSRDRSGGVELSGGQWQQVVLARALYAVHTGARVLVLDEPTAHLDVRSEQELFQRLLGLPGEVSVVLISHRLATVRLAQRIVLLADGRITESGTHDELIAAGGEYARMFTIQAERLRRGYDDRLEDDRLEDDGLEDDSADGSRVTEGELV